MSNPSNRDPCRRVEESLAAILSGDLDEELLEHIASCDSCRDLRHDAAMAAELIESAGADYTYPDDFGEQLLAKLESCIPETGAQPSDPDGEASADIAHEPTPSATADAVAESCSTERAPEQESAASEPADRASVRPAGDQPGAIPIATRQSVRKSGSAKRTTAIAVSIVGLASLAAAALLAMHFRAPHEPTTGTESASWRGKVKHVQVASKDSSKGLERCNADGSGCVVLSDGSAVEPGSLLRTDARARVHIELSDGTALALDRLTELVLGARPGRVVDIHDGVVVADVAHVEGSNARFELPQGYAEVLGTKLQITASADRTLVEVARGTVRLADRQGKSVMVRAGEGGALARGSGPEVAPTAELGEAFVWSEAGETDSAGRGSVRGLGELRARKPGHKDELSQAVRLARHDVNIRIAGSMARTEIDETFTNETDDVLEGVYRFPLPPDAQIERLALEVDGKLEEGAFVDKERAAAIWRGVMHAAAPKAPRPREEIIWVPGPWRDPALLEWQRGGRFELRIYPIPKRGSRRIVLAYTQAVPAVGDVRRYTYPLSYDPGGSTHVDSFNATVQVRGNDRDFGVRTRGYELASQRPSDDHSERLVMNASSFVPSGDLTVQYKLPEDAKEMTAWTFQPSQGSEPGVDATGHVDGAYVAVALRPRLPRWSEGTQRDQIIVVDASRSMIGERFSRAVQVVESIVREMDRRDRFAVLVCDTGCVSMSSQLQSPGARRR